MFSMNHKEALVFQLVLVLPRLTIPQLLSLFFPVECYFSHCCSAIHRHDSTSTGAHCPVTASTNVAGSQCSPPALMLLFSAKGMAI